MLFKDLLLYKLLLEYKLLIGMKLLWRALMLKPLPLTSTLFTIIMRQQTNLIRHGLFCKLYVYLSNYREKLFVNALIIHVSLE